MRVTRVANPGLVPQSAVDDSARSSTHQGKAGLTKSTEPSFGSSSNLAQTKSDGLPLVREKLNLYNLSDKAKDIVIASWRRGNVKQYRTYLKKWQQYCSDNEYDVYKPGLHNAIEFLVMLYHSGLG